VDKNPSKLCYTKIKEKDKDFVRIHGIFDPANDKVLKDASYPWAIKIDGQNYINLRYVNDYPNNEVYARPDIEGVLNVFIIDDNTSDKVKAGLGRKKKSLTGLIVDKIDKRGSSWADKNGVKHALLIFNTDMTYLSTQYGHTSAFAKLLSKRNFRQVFHTKHTEEEIDAMSYEDVIALIHKLNQELS